MKKSHETLITICLFGLVVWGILLGCGTITSGFHMVDDHEMIGMYIDKLNGVPILEEIRRFIIGDFHWRFRPLFYVVRVCLSYFSNGNFVALSILRGVEVVFSLELIYWILRKMNCSYFYAVIGSLMSLMGSMVGIWWKLGPQELTATWMFALAVLCFLKAEEGKEYLHFGCIFWLIVVSLYKESFIMLLPVFLFLYVMDFSKKNDSLSEFWMVFTNRIKANWVKIFILGLVFLGELYCILFVIGHENIEYGAIEFDKNIWFYVKVFLNNARLPLRMGQYALFCLVVILLYRTIIIDRIKKWWREVVVFFLIVTPQLLIYAKNGIEERYVIPCIFGVVYFFVGVISKDQWLCGLKRKIYNISLLILTLFNLILTVHEAKIFTYRGESIQEMLQFTEENTNPDSNILASFNGYGESEATIKRWGYFHQRENIYRHTDVDGVYVSENGKKISLEDIDIILFYDKSERHYLYEPPIDFSDFEIKHFGAMRVAKRIRVLAE